MKRWITNGKKYVLIFFLLISIIGIVAIGFYLFNTGPYLTILNLGSSAEIEEAFPHLSFNKPVGIYSANDGSNRLFVLEQVGIIKVFENSPTVSSYDTFLDISDRVDFGGEKGLLGLAFHPNYKNNGYFYVDYTTTQKGGLKTRISRFSVDPNDPNKADPTGEVVLLEVSQPYENHNGGQIAFGPDGHLYISLGDGGSGGDPLGHGQNPKTLLGSILRIDVDGNADGKPYDIPSDNPFVNNTQGYKEEIFAYGLRNPWRFSFDPLTGWLWAGDVGQNRQEEIDIIQKGKNYGWNIMEGELCFQPSSGCNHEGLELPIWTYGRDQGISIIGGFVYRGNEIPRLRGKYVYGDDGSGKIWALSYDGNNPPKNEELTDTNLYISSFGIDDKNELYICSYRDGKIYKLKSDQGSTRTTTSKEYSFLSFQVTPLESFALHSRITLTLILLLPNKIWLTKIWKLGR